MVSFSEESPNDTIQKYRDAETEEEIAHIEGGGVPVPDVGEIVAFGELSVRAEGKIPVDTKIDDPEEAYVVQERAYQFNETDIQTADTEIDNAIVATVLLLVTPLDEYDESNEDL